MNLVKPALIIGALGCALVAHAQFGASSKSDLMPSDDKKLGVLGNGYFLNQSAGGASISGYLFNFEKALDVKAKNLSSISGYIANLDGTSFQNLTYRTYLAENYGLLGGATFASGQNSYQVFAFYDLKRIEMSEGKALTVQVGAGGIYGDVDKKTDFAAFVRASYPLQNHLSVDLSYLLSRAAGTNINTLAIGLGYRF